MTIQNIIYYIKNNYNSNEYYTDSDSKYQEGSEYVFKLMPKIINNKTFNIIDNDNEFLIIFMNLINLEV